MGLGMGFVWRQRRASGPPDFSVSGDSAIGFSGMEMETGFPFQDPGEIIVLNNGESEWCRRLPKSLEALPAHLTVAARYDK
ncbi:MAG: hypothetical protein Ct9H300mP13_8560 [Gammaproteobacteria bacterium]|nr:MAG: hypothetical protein Ct9H300mP13_8560 [Gammaproteobacteria bacterium]